MDGDEKIKEMANLCLMAKEDNSLSEEDEEIYDFYTFDELEDAFDDLSSKFEELGSRHIALKKNFSKLETKVKTLKKKNEVLMKEKSILRKSTDDFSFNLEGLLSSQRQSLSKHGLGYNPFSAKKT